MGLMICRWDNSVDDGIYWLGDESDKYTLFEVMKRYLTTGETMEILAYDPDDRQDMVAMLNNERLAHKRVQEVTLPE